MLYLSVKQEYFEAIKLGTKIVEGRLNNNKFKDLKPGMFLTFTSAASREQISCSVEAVNTYLNFKEMLETEGVQNLLPGITLLETAISIYESFPGYKEKVKEMGALAIHFKIINTPL